MTAPDVLLVTAAVLSLCALVASVVSVALVRSSTPLKLHARQTDLETHMETVVRGCTRLETAWTQFLADREELEESIREQVQRVNTKTRAVAAREARLSAAAEEAGFENGRGESLEDFEKRMMREARR